MAIDPVLCAAWVTLVNTPCRLAAISHLDLYVHVFCGWICCSQGIKFSNSDGGVSEVRLKDIILRMTSYLQLQKTSSLCTGISVTTVEKLHYCD